MTHRWAGKILHWHYCIKCGLITLKNRATESAMRRACPGSEE